MGLKTSQSTNTLAGLLVSLLLGFTTFQILLANRHLTVVRQPASSSSLPPPPPPLLQRASGSLSLAPPSALPTPRTPLPATFRPVCKNEFTAQFNASQLQRALLRRLDFTFGLEFLAWQSAGLDANMGRPKKGWVRANRENTFADRIWSGLQHDHARFDAVGPIVLPCPQLQTFGAVLCSSLPSALESHRRFTPNQMCVDEEKRMCQDLSALDDCAVFSVGSNDQWMFEMAVVNRTRCTVYVFDCFAHLHPPEELRGRVRLFNVCLGPANFVDPGGRTFVDFLGLSKLAGRAATFLKMDVEGFEWDILPSIVQLSKAHYRDTGEDIFPSQIAVELHYLSKFGVDWQGRDKTPVEIAMLFNHLFSHGGYVLVDRNDNNMCRHCTEILLARTWCDA